FGLSFNTVLGSSGWALQGEYSLRQNAPLQIAERVVLEDGLSPIITALGLARAAPAQLPAFLQNYRPRKVQGYVESDVSQLQATATRLYGPTLGANALVVLAEAAVMHVHDMPMFPWKAPPAVPLILLTPMRTPPRGGTGSQRASTTTTRSAPSTCTLTRSSCMTSAATARRPAARSWRAGPDSLWG
ncbi:MAG: DUF1302 domain-containing protein, partial [Gammaproteobacteria bacterium]|nr:DUF1302 domain-containing protein [Gammaproteobacteria bacterium]